MELAEKIRALGYTVDEHVLRVDGVLDIYLPSCKWRDLTTGERGHKPQDQLLEFIVRRLEVIHALEAVNETLPNL